MLNKVKSAFGGNRKILTSSISILASLGLVAGATFAFFSDVGTSSDNIFASGTLDLDLSDDTAEGPADDVTASFGGTDMAPGDCTASQQLRLRNSGTVTGNHVDITETNTNTLMADFLRIDTLDYDTSSVLGEIAESGNNSFKDLADWAADANGVTDLSLTDLDTDHNLDLVVCLDESAGDDLQGSSNTATFTATLRQQTHASE